MTVPACPKMEVSLSWENVGDLAETPIPEITGRQAAGSGRPT